MSIEVELYADISKLRYYNTVLINYEKLLEFGRITFNHEEKTFAIPAEDDLILFSIDVVQHLYSEGLIDARGVVTEHLKPYIERLKYLVQRDLLNEK